MAERLDAIVGTKSKTGKTYWTKVGAAFRNQSGGYTLFLDFLPLHKTEDGKTMIVLAEPKERDAGERGGGDRRDDRRDDRSDNRRQSRDRDMDDEVPF